MVHRNILSATVQCAWRDGFEIRTGFGMLKLKGFTRFGPQKPIVRLITFIFFAGASDKIYNLYNNPKNPFKI